jgi:thiopeptide-type bacteriocin biosynthesis protein
VRRHLQAEQTERPDAVYAEIVHLPTGRLVNVVARPVLRDHELEWLGRSGAPRERVIPASDLLLSLRDGRFILRSPTLGRRVVPRLTSAHNYNRHSPGVYRFLAAVQSDGCVQRVGWTWYPFDAAPFTPRVRRGPVVLALARWRAGGAELRALDLADPLERWQAVFEWRRRRHLPRWICLVELDNVLAFDLDNAVSVDAFIRTVRDKDDVLLEELFPGPEELVAAGPDGPRALEVIVPFVRAAAVPAPAPPVVSSAPARRTFPPGSEWTYLKLYTGSATADRLLTEEIGPCVRGLVAVGATDQWFFVRYEDPRFHLRVRAHGDPDRIRARFEALAARAIDEGLASDVQFGTYVREIERYGGAHGIVVAERMFHADSDAVVDVLDRCHPGGQGLDARWRIGLLGADRILADLDLSLPARFELARIMRARFEREFRADSRLRKDVAAKVPAELPAVEDLMLASAGTGHALASGIAVLDERSARIAPLAVQLGDLVDVVAPSLVHMWLNRLCRSQSRRQEYVTYALLARVYEVRRARARR